MNVFKFDIISRTDLIFKIIRVQDYIELTIVLKESNKGRMTADIETCELFTLIAHLELSICGQKVIDFNDLSYHI